MSKNTEPVWYLSKIVWKHSENKSKVILYLILFFFSNIVLLLFPLLIAQIVNTIQLEGVTSSSIYKIMFWIIGFLVLEVAFWALHGPGRVLETINAFKVKASYKLHLLEGVMDLNSSWHANHQSGDTIDKIEKGTKALYDFAEYGFMVVASVIKLVGATAILFFFNVPAGIIIMLLVVATIIVVRKFDNKLIKHFYQLNTMDNHISAKVYDTISNITTVIILRLETLLTKSLTTKIMHPLPLFSKNVKLKEIKWFTVSVLATLMIVTTLSAYVFTHFRSGEVILIGSLLALYQYVETINNIFFHFTYQYGEIVKQKTDVENAEILAEDFKLKNRIPQLKMTNSNWQILEIKNLGFHYENPDADQIDSKKPATLTVKNLIIHKGEKIALVGESGAGKTTFLKLLRDLYSPQKIEVYLDDARLHNGFKELANSISLIPQDPEIFASTIEDNITFGIRSSRSEIKRFTDIARFSSVIPSLPNGLKSSINERGVNLSGGQKQRLALARGLLASRTKEIILLDEPTSSVDSHNELLIYQGVLKEFREKTIISSMHRLHLLPYFDRIFYFENGKIVQTGSLAELLASNKRFRSLWDKYKNVN